MSPIGITDIPDAPGGVCFRGEADVEPVCSDVA